MREGIALALIACRGVVSSKETADDADASSSSSPRCTANRFGAKSALNKLFRGGFFELNNIFQRIATGLFRGKCLI